MNNSKVCNRCSVLKPYEEFYKDKNHSTGRYSFCKTCKNARTGEWRVEKREIYNASMRAYNKKHHRRIHYKRSYGITPEQYNEMLKAQNGVCAICKKPAASLGVGKRPFVVDHCHHTDRIRGILCYGCNRAIVIMENPELYRIALAYLKN